MKGLRIIILATLLLTFAVPSHAAPYPMTFPLEISDEWSTVLEEDGITVEYKVQECNNSQVNNQVLVLFRFINTSSDQVKTIQWSAKEFRNGDCFNCDRLTAPEFVHSLTLSPGETVEGDGTSKMDKRVYLFSHFIELVPGMSDQKLTGFEFVHVDVQSQEILND